MERPELEKSDNSIVFSLSLLQQPELWGFWSSSLIAALPIIVMDPKLVLERHHVVSSPWEEPHSFNQGDEEI